jgi:cyclic dehypoxanthinyl futalosine synthase
MLYQSFKDILPLGMSKDKHLLSTYEYHIVRPGGAFAVFTKEELTEKVHTGTRLSRDQALAMWRLFEYTELATLAQNVRFRQNPEPVVTYLVDRNINYTNVCNSDCSFCAFYRHDPKDPEAYVLSRDILAQKVEEAVALGASRILLQGGHNDDLPYDFYLDMISWLSSSYPVQLNAFSPSEIHQMSLVSGKSSYQILSELKQCGLYGLPGGGAEILHDEVRKRISPKKISSGRWLEIMREAHSLDLVTTATMVIGFGESLEHRIEHLEQLRSLQDESHRAGHAGFNLFISWTHQFNERTSLGRSRHVAKYGAGAVEYLKNVAWSRIVLDNIQHHQSSWPTCGAHVAEIGLHSGCDDIGSTMMEENVVSQAGAPTAQKWSMSPDELELHIRQAGFEPKRRDSNFAILG